MTLSYSDLAAFMGTADPEVAGAARGYSIDSRTVEPGDVFFALPGERTDGHFYVSGVLGSGAAAVVDQPVDGTGMLFRVPSVLTALQMAARSARVRWGARVVCVTGSAGKTGTKDIIAELLRTRMKVGSTDGNLNNHIGLPLSILRLPDEAQVAVLELGMNHAGEIRDLAGIAKPEIGVVTNVGYAHVENFPDGIDGVAAAKRELIEALPPDGVAVLNSDDERIRSFAAAHNGRSVTFGLQSGAEFQAERVQVTEAGATVFHLRGCRFETSLSGDHSIRNILAGLAVAAEFGIEPETLVEAVKALQPGPMRGQRIRHAGITIINDCYNSNPEAARAMLDVLRQEPGRRRIAVLGEMRELGHWSEALHRDVGSYAACSGISVLVGIRGVARSMVQAAIEQGLGEDAAYFFDEPEEAGEWLRSFVQPGDVMLFKGSRGTHVERALERLLR